MIRVVKRIKEVFIWFRIEYESGQTRVLSGSVVVCLFTTLNWLMIHVIA